MAYQEALFPLVTQGPGEVHLPQNEAFILRIALFTTNVTEAKPLMKLWGRIADKDASPLATLYLRDGRLVWVCPTDTKRDSLFDAAAPVEVNSSKVVAGAWNSFDLLVNPAAYQQTFGWSQAGNDPCDPVHPKKHLIQMARQLSSAAWDIHHIELLPMTKVWIGGLDLLPPDTSSLAITPNIRSEAQQVRKASRP